MNRRELLTMLCGAPLLCGTIGTKAQTAKSVRRIGLVSGGVRPDAAEYQLVWAPTRQLGWVEGKNLIIERRYAAGKLASLDALVEELLRLPVELIVTNGSPATLAAKNATTRIPIVMLSAYDPVGGGLVASLARPGGNITGFYTGSADLDAKRLALLHELLPTAERIGVLVNPSDPHYAAVRNENDRVYQSLGMHPTYIEVTTVAGFENAVAEAAQRRAQALVVTGSPLFNQNGSAIMGAALRHTLPAIVGDEDLLNAGGLLSLSVDPGEVYRVLAYCIDKILRGAKPADIPVQQPSKFVLSINLKTAETLGIAIPHSLLLRADEVIR